MRESGLPSTRWQHSRRACGSLFQESLIIHLFPGQAKHYLYKFV